ncbi:ABC transporter ATP-binding protein [Ruminiclostridium herbifermentans]|uniref:ABC transporter ATP-binding protein n=1 Tax=Ruminiclostridium herbifermentans TaxID=2488810 RepID=A0A4U7JIA9_9FIRM|nr:ABC transporter ATP-binding protein [Ruminiclostridium herbifermentans]QNU67073.1 ABC transporter ATP-binding protein [Ruminiclostridium herbifermentans]
MLAIRTINLKKVYKNTTVVNNLNLNVPYGSVYGFLGPNGAGKTTTIRMLLGLAKPTSGEIYIASNKICFNDTKYKYDIGFVPDVPSFYKWMTAKEYLYFCGNIFNLKKSVIRERTKKLLDIVGLEDSSKPIGSYSRGMKQRLGIAQTLIHNPKVVLLDEPTSALDPIGRKEILDIIKKLSGETTVFFSTHILNDVESVCDKVCVLDKGNLLVEDSITNLKKEYFHLKYNLKTSARNDEIIKCLSNYEYFLDIKDSIDGGIEFLSKNGEEIERIIPQVISNNNWGLLEFKRVEPSLEDIFMEVLKKNEPKGINS